MSLWDNLVFFAKFAWNLIPLQIAGLRFLIFIVLHKVLGVDPDSKYAYPSAASLPNGVKKGEKPCPYAVSSDKHQYIAPKEYDARSPCPALNTMANHGYLPRDGRKLSGTVLTHALMECYNLSWPLAAFLSWGGVYLLGQVGLFSLHDLARHNRIEHDASLTHANTFPDEEYAPTLQDPVLYKAFLADARKDHFMAEDIARARVRREGEHGAAMTAVQQEIARGESALVLQIFGKTEFAVPVDVIHSWWHEERLPDGWRPTRQTTLIGTIHWATVIREAMNALRDDAQAGVVKEVRENVVVQKKTHTPPTSNHTLESSE